MSDLLGLSVLSDLGGSGALFALLLAGHALGDFVFQSGRMVRHKNETKWLLFHCTELTICQAVMLLPVMSMPIVLGLLAIFSTHAAIDRLKTSTEGGPLSPVAHFFIDQLLHVLVLCGVWRALVEWSEVTTELEPWGPGLITAALIVSAAAFNVHGASALVSLWGGEPREEKTRRSARLIGICERQVMLALLLLAQWLAFALLVASRMVGKQESSDHDASVLTTLMGAVMTLAAVLIVKVLT